MKKQRCDPMTSAELRKCVANLKQQRITIDHQIAIYESRIYRLDNNIQGTVYYAKSLSDYLT